MVLNDLGVKPKEGLMVAAHAWDLAGAKNVGLQTAFIARPGKALYPNVARPDYVVDNLTELAKVLPQADSTAEGRWVSPKTSLILPFGPCAALFTTAATAKPRFHWEETRGSRTFTTVVS